MRLEEDDEDYREWERIILPYMKDNANRGRVQNRRHGNDSMRWYRIQDNMIWARTTNNKIHHTKPNMRPKILPTNRARKEEGRNDHMI